MSLYTKTNIVLTHKPTASITISKSYWPIETLNHHIIFPIGQIVKKSSNVAVTLIDSVHLNELQLERMCRMFLLPYIYLFSFFNCSCFFRRFDKFSFLIF